MSALAVWGPRVARVLLGLIFFVFGLNFFVPFIPMTPPPMDAAATSFMTGLEASRYIMPIVKTIEVVAGLALLVNRFVPMALILLAPIIINIAGVHFLLIPNYGMPIFLLILEAYLAWSYRAAFAPLFQAKAAPVGAPATSPSGSLAAAR